MAEVSIATDSVESSTDRVQFARHDELPFDRLKSLFESMKGDIVHSPFQVPAFLDAFRQHAAPAATKSCSILTATLEGNRTPDLLLPLVTFRRGPVNVVTMPDFGLADQNAPVLSRAMAEQHGLATQLLNRLFDTYKLGDLVDIHKIGALIGNIPNPLFDLPEAFETGSNFFYDSEALETVETRSGKSVFKEARSKFRKLQKQGVDLFEVTEPEERCALLDQMLEQRRKRFADLGRVNSIETENRAAFYRALAQVPGSDSPFKVLALKKGQEVVAAAALMAHGGCANGVLISIGDAAWHRLSPGIVLVVQSLRWARERGVFNFSFGTGLQGYKKRFSPHEQPVRRLLRPTSVKGRVFTAAMHAKSRARSLLERSTDG